MSFSIGCGGNTGDLKGWARARLARLISVLLFFACGIAAASAQTATPSSSYITPFPHGDRYQIRVIGDWFGAGLTAGLQDALKSEASLEVSDMSRSGYGLARAEQNGLSAEAGKMLSGGSVHIAVLMMGMNDKISIRTAAGNVQPGSAEWKELYGKEAERLIKQLRHAGVAVYWVGLPPMSNPGLNEFVASLNDTVRQAVYLNGAKFVETSAGFTDQSGAYSAWGADISGQTKRLREGDGAGLRPRLIARSQVSYETSIRRDLAQARSQRNVPLAGDEEEQARVVPSSVHNSPAKSAAAEGAKPGTAPASGWKPETPSGKPDAAAAKVAPAGVKTEALAAIPAAPDPARRDQAAFAEAGNQSGEYILAELGNGLTSIAVITPVGDFSMREIQRQTPLADRLYFKVLSRGEALPAKEGRADDFRWHGEETTQSQ